MSESNGVSERMECSYRGHIGESKKHDSPISPQRPAGEQNNKQRKPPNKRFVSLANTLEGVWGDRKAASEDGESV
jgi:hypothetical protein